MTYWGYIIRFVAIAVIIAGVIIIKKKSKIENITINDEIEIND